MSSDKYFLVFFYCHATQQLVRIAVGIEGDSEPRLEEYARYFGDHKEFWIDKARDRFSGKVGVMMVESIDGIVNFK